MCIGCGLAGHAVVELEHGCTHRVTQNHQGVAGFACVGCQRSVVVQGAECQACGEVTHLGAHGHFGGAHAESFVSHIFFLQCQTEVVGAVVPLARHAVQGLVGGGGLGFVRRVRSFHHDVGKLGTDVNQVVCLAFVNVVKEGGASSLGTLTMDDHFQCIAFSPEHGSQATTVQSLQRRVMVTGQEGSHGVAFQADKAVTACQEAGVACDVLSLAVFRRKRRFHLENAGQVFAEAAIALDAEARCVVLQHGFGQCAVVCAFNGHVDATVQGHRRSGLCEGRRSQGHACGDSQQGFACDRFHGSDFLRVKTYCQNSINHKGLNRQRLVLNFWVTVR